jgi:hypothetical protein
MVYQQDTHNDHREREKAKNHFEYTSTYIFQQEIPQIHLKIILPLSLQETIDPSWRVKESEGKWRKVKESEGKWRKVKESEGKW